MIIWDAKIRNCHRELMRLDEAVREADRERDDAAGTSLASACEAAYKRAYDAFYGYLKVYAKAVYEKYAPQKPLLIRNEDKKVVAWEEAFGTSLETATDFMLVDLIEGGGKYRLK